MELRGLGEVRADRRLSAYLALAVAATLSIALWQSAHVRTEINKMAIVSGRVTTADGRPVVGANVVLASVFATFGVRKGQMPIPADAFVAVTGHAGQYAFSQDMHPTLRERRDGALALARVARDARSLGCSLRAILGEQVSQAVVIDWCNEKELRIHDLVLRSGATAVVVVHRPDGSPAEGVALSLLLTDQNVAADDDRAAAIAFEGTTDTHGMMACGPVSDHTFSCFVRATHAEAPPLMKAHEDWVVRNGPLDVTLRMGREVRGTVVLATGEAAIQYRVAAWEPVTGDPETRYAVATDSQGCFVLHGAAVGAGALAFYERSAEAPWGDGDRLSNPLLIVDCPGDVDDLGTIVLPKARAPR